MPANAEESASASEELSAQAEQMNTIVQDLVNLVGGSNSQGVQKTKSVMHHNNAAQKTHEHTHKLTKLDHTIHHIASGTGARNETKVSKEKAKTAKAVIPLDDSKHDDLKEFNS